MLIGCAYLLIASASLAEVPPLIAAKLASTNEVRGTFVQTKTDADGRMFVTRGTYRIRPGVDFTWRTTDPFETCFTATPTNYVYANEDETITRPLSDLPGSRRFGAFGKGDYSDFFRLFEATYAETNGCFAIRAKPIVRDLKRALDRVEAEGATSNWTLRVAFPNRVALRLDLKDDR